MLLGSDELSRELASALRHLGAEVGREYPDAPDDRRRTTPSVVGDQTAATGLRGDRRRRGLPRRPRCAGRRPRQRATELVPSARTVRLTADREGLRRLAADQLGLPTAPFWFVGSVDDLKAVAAHAGFPLLVEPVAGTADRKGSVAAGPADIEPAWQRAVGRRAPAGAGRNRGRDRVLRHAARNSQRRPERPGDRVLLAHRSSRRPS